MPQAAGRKVAFSGKKKKEQIKAKRTRKMGGQGSSGEISGFKGTQVQRINDVGGNSGGRSTRYALVFQQQTKEELDNLKKKAREQLEFLGENGLQLSDFCEDSLDMPRRPKWDSSWSKEKLDAQENKYFREFTDNIIASQPDISYFEMNLETWRQLWRVLEMSDIVLLVTDIRYPLIHIPVSLIQYVNELGKRLIIVLNKVDLVPPEKTAQWIQFLTKKFQGIKVVPFASYAGCKNVGKRGRGKYRSPLNSCLGILSSVKELVEEDKLEVDMTSWEKKIREDFAEINENADVELQIDEVVSHDEVLATSGLHDGFLTIGMIGHPNVGKSSLLNALMGKKVVSVSRTPGHTKHFQTIFLTKQLRLCDCPGLVFPTTHPRELQVISGSFPIAQLRVPLSAVQYIAERIHVERILRLPKIETDEKNWSAFEISESWALKRGFLTAKTGRPDVNRAANNILRMALDGRTLCVAFSPPKNETEPVDQSLVKKIEELSGPPISSSELVGDSDITASDSEDSTENGSEQDGEDEDVPRTVNKFSMLMMNE